MSRVTVAPANGIVSLRKTCAGRSVLTASTSRFPTGTRPTVKVPVASEVAAYWLWSVWLVIRSLVPASTVPSSASVRPV